MRNLLMRRQNSIRAEVVALEAEQTVAQLAAPTKHIRAQIHSTRPIWAESRPARELIMAPPPMLLPLLMMMMVMMIATITGRPSREQIFSE